jgi:Arc/MetJ-type ribon-helix-helix transcriptional regulator
MGESSPFFLLLTFGIVIVELRERYTTVKIPYELAEKLDAFSADLGYRSRAEIVNDAVRRFIDERKRLDEPLSKFGESQDRSRKNKILA